uniref:NADH-ubiquinone oxidoreductase chain 6 n=1 Tax=Mordellidae sp. GENSP01 TaxID=1205565 RepID=A0A0S2MS09_9CUCU|nr:NADH deshydrogenase subunit 6 [Mordellidae sp. GENSP01]
MLNMLIMINMIMSILFVASKHPLSMGSILLLQTIMVTMLLGNMAPNFWFSYILFLIMVGGMLVLFIYMTSIASNEKFKISFKNINHFKHINIIISSTTKFSLITNMNLNNNEFYQMNINTSFNQLIIKFMNWPTMTTMMFLIMYLLITLIATVKITNISYGPLRISN